MNQTASVASPAFTTVLGSFLGMIALGTVFGNMLVILAIVLVKKLRTPSNFLIVSLAISDLLVGILVIPFAGVKTVYEQRWPLGKIACDIYISFDVLLCTSSILSLCAISIDRYLAITKPLRYAARRTPRRMMIMIVVTWIVSAMIVLPPVFSFQRDTDVTRCDYSEDVTYQIYATCVAFYIPLLVMIVLYGRIFCLAQRMAHDLAKQKRAAEAVASLHESNFNPHQTTIQFNNHANVQSNNTDPTRNLQNNTTQRASGGTTSTIATTITTTTEKYPLPPSELCRRRKPRPLHRTVYPDSCPNEQANHDNVARETSIERMTGERLETPSFRMSELSLKDEFEQRVERIRLLRADFFSSPPARYNSVLIFSNRPGHPYRGPTEAASDLDRRRSDIGQKITVDSRAHQLLQQSHSMREPSKLPLLSQKQHNPPPQLSISYCSNGNNQEPSPMEASDPTTAFTALEKHRSSSALTTQPGMQILRPKQRPFYGTRRSMSSMTDTPRKGRYSRSLLGIPFFSSDRRSSSPNIDNFRWCRGSNDRNRATGSLENKQSPRLSEEQTGVVPSKSRNASFSSVRNFNRKRRSKGHSESKAIKTLGVIMGCFIICWLPFFVIALYSAIYKSVTGFMPTVDAAMDSLFLWLGYLNSTINPIIYAIFNRDFRMPFKEIICCRCRKINARLRSQRFATEYGPTCPSNASNMYQVPPMLPNDNGFTADRRCKTRNALSMPNDHRFGRLSTIYRR